MGRAGVAWIVGITLAARASRAGLGLTPTDSLVERFGLFTIIVVWFFAVSRFLRADAWGQP